MLRAETGFEICLLFHPTDAVDKEKDFCLHVNFTVLSGSLSHPPLTHTYTHTHTHTHTHNAMSILMLKE